MAIKRVKKKEHENLSDANISRVMELLADKNPITKKTACEVLNIAYNTTRLTNIIEGYVVKKANEKKHRDANRGKPVNDYEIQQTIEQYLAGTTVSDIAKGLFRSPSFINNIIERLGVPKRATGDDKRYPILLPEACVSYTFKPDQIAWSAVYHAPCKIIKEVRNTKQTDYEENYGCKCYNIYVIEPLEEALDMYPNIKTGGFYATSIAYNLGSLEHLFKYDIKLEG